MTQKAIAVLKIDEGRPWLALTVRPRHEKAAAGNLRLRGLEEYLPLYPARRRWSDRVTMVELPLFPGYVFCRFDYRSRQQVLNTPGVTSVVGFGKEDAPVDASDIDAIRRILSSGLPVEPRSYLEAGDAVRIERGPLSGIQGTLVREKSAWRVVVNVELLQRSVAVEVDRMGISLVGRKIRKA